ncbi:PIN domain-containing protein [Methylosinus sp. PW1]|uniref:PIN domain-containing protein n=1 Tax=Methylosinus sp. PW1 TaxID=107636 RepID=UPI00068AFB68|nr:PIN domain-containing protein [Methylosinus sp. PW1]
MIVIDASVAVKWFVREAHHERALDVLDQEWERIAPDLILPEVANVLRKKLRNREISQDQTAVGLESVSVAIPRLVPSSELANDAMALSLELDHSVYDCFYLACALGRGVLLSSDLRFIRKCVERGYRESVAILEEVDFEQLGTRISVSSVTPHTFESIERLSKKIKGTVQALTDAARASSASPMNMISTESLKPVFSSPAYRRLASELERLDVDQLAVVVALGWLGRGHSATEWTNLYENARHMTARGFSAHRAYFMAQMSNVPGGLTKLKTYLQDASSAGPNGV